MYKLFGKLALLIMITSPFASANDVFIFYSSGDVIVYGDIFNNEIDIRCLGHNVHEFRGRNGTLINGSTKPVILPILDDLNIQMDAGTDVVTIRSLNLFGRSHADLIVRMGDGDDEIDLSNANVRRRIQILSDLKNQGNDTISVFNSDSDTLYVETQGASDIAVLYNDCGWIYIDAGIQGADDLAVVANDAEIMNISTSNAADDLIFVSNRISNGYALIELLAGNDIAQFSSNQLSRASLRVDGGADVDRISNNGTSYWPWPAVFVNFE